MSSVQESLTINPTSNMADHTPTVDDLFSQPAPQLGHDYHDQPQLSDLLGHYIPAQLLTELTPALETMGALSTGELYHQQLADRLNEPVLTQWDAWGRRIDNIVLTPVWQRAAQLAAEFGVVAHGYNTDHGAAARLHQFAMAYLFIPSTDFYGCPMAMTDGAAATLRATGNEPLQNRALPHLLSRVPATAWTSGQWMTETTGGSDVGGSETIARQDAAGQWRLYGRKWFTSAATSQMTLTLARPEGAPAGSKGLALFYLEPHDAQGQLQNIQVLRLKDKLGTRKLPTAELWLDGVAATPVKGLDRGVPNISPMLTITRTWNAVTAASLFGRGLALAQAYSRQRKAFGQYLIDLPLHRSTLARLNAQHAATFQLAFLQVRLLGQVEHGNEEISDLMRIVTPIAKLATAKRCVAGLSETLECFGGAGYVEDTGLPALLRDAQVLPIWEGTTNVLSLDLLRALGKTGGLQPVHDYLNRAVAALGDGWHAALTREVDEVSLWLQQSDDHQRQAGARHAALKLARVLELCEIRCRAAENPQRAAYYQAQANLLNREQTVTLPTAFSDDDNVLAEV